jgi:hypothetical protein
MQWLEPHLAIVSGSQESNSIDLNSGTTAIFVTCACDPKRSEP